MGMWKEWRIKKMSKEWRRRKYMVGKRKEDWGRNEEEWRTRGSWDWPERTLQIVGHEGGRSKELTILYLYIWDVLGLTSAKNYRVMEIHFRHDVVHVGPTLLAYRVILKTTAIRLLNWFPGENLGQFTRRHADVEQFTENRMAKYAEKLLPLCEVSLAYQWNFDVTVLR